MFGRHGLVRPPPMATMNVQLDMNQPRTPVTDSRALQNLIKAEKTYVDELLTMSSASLTAASSLHAWGMSETPDLDAATAHVGRLLENAANANKTYAQASEQYREALRDILDREQSIRSIVRDRDILMSRVIKASKRKPTHREMISGDREHHARLLETQRELHACEQTLVNETAALVGVKRRTFKEALTMRTKSMGDLGAIMMDSARNILVFLDSFDANIPVAPAPVAPMSVPDLHPTYTDIASPGMQAQESMSHGDSFQGYPAAGPTSMLAYDADADDALRPAMQHPLPDIPASDSPVPGFPPTFDTFGTLSAVRDDTSSVTEVTPRAAPVPASDVPTKRRPRRRMSDLSSTSLPQVPGGVPAAPRMNLDQARSGFVPPTVPGGVPTAPRAFVRHADDSSDEERAPPSTVDSSVVQRAPRRAAADSDDGHPRGGGGFFSRMTSLFRTEMRAAPPSRRHSRSGSYEASRDAFDRTVHVPRREPRREHKAASHSHDALFAPMTESRRVRGAGADDSSDEDMPGTAVVHVNEPGAFRAASLRNQSAESDAFAEEVRRSVIGAGIAGPTKSKAPSRPASATGIRQGPPSSRRMRSNSIDAVETIARPPSSTSTRKVKRRTSSDQLGAKPMRRTSSDQGTSTGAKTVRRKRRDSAAHPPPAPSSYYVGFSNNPAKFATDSWIAKSDAPSRSTTPQPASGTGLVAASPAQASRSATPLRSAMKGGRDAVNATPQHLSTDMARLSLDPRFDGTGHLDFSIPDALASPTKQQQTSAAPPLSYLGAVTTPQRAADTDLGTETAETYRAYLNGGVTESAAPARTASGLAPPITSMPSFYTTSESAAPAAAPAPSPAARSRKSVRIEDDTPALAPAETQEGRRRATWSTRIGRDDDSSDEEDGAQGDGDEYANARKAFGSATRHLGVATGTIQPKQQKKRRDVA